MINSDTYNDLIKTLTNKNAVLVAVSKTKPAEAIQELYNLGHRDFGENYVQELVDKQAQLPNDIRWHFIGHLQTNKVKYITPFVHLIQGVDSFKLLNEINKQAKKLNRVIQVLLQVHIAQEETKFGLDENELEDIMAEVTVRPMSHICIRGLMGMASFSDDEEVVKSEFTFLKKLFDKYAHFSKPDCLFSIVSMGMSSDYQIALAEGSTMVRIGSLLFGERKPQ